MRKLILAAVLLAPLAAHAQTAADYLARCKHHAEVVAPAGSPRYRQIVLACMQTESERIESNTAALNAYAAHLREHGYGY